MSGNAELQIHNELWKVTLIKIDIIDKTPNYYN